MIKKNRKRSIAFLTAVIIMVAIFPLTAFAAGLSSYSISAGSVKNCNFPSHWAGDVFTFTPSVTGYYRFYSYSNTEGDPYFYLTNSSGYNSVYNALASTGYRNDTARDNSLVYNDDSGGGRDFSLSYLCYAGQTYYCFATKYSSAQTTYNFLIDGPSYNTVTLNKNGGSGGSNYYYNNVAYWLYTNSSSSTNYITPPTRSGYTFTGFYNQTSGGTRMIDSNGYIRSGNYNGTLYAQWQQNVYTLTFNNQGVANTTATVTSGASLPGSVTPPKRDGYDFTGYYTASSGGNQYYTSTGARNTATAMSGNLTLYARWIPKQFNITYEGMSGAAYGSSNPGTHTYGQATTVSDPTKTEHTFMGWSVNGQNTLSRNLVLGATSYTNNITLTANWKKQTDVSIEDTVDLQANTQENKADLNKVFENPVSDAAAGVTSDEMSNNASVKLTLKVTNTVGSPAGETQIKEAAQGEIVKFFDAKVEKTITSLSGTPTTTTLKEIPVRIAVSIPLTGELADKASYSVFRYHTFMDKNNPVEEIHQISSDPRDSEYYTIENENLIVYTRMFSTFAIAAGEKVMTPSPSYNGNMADATSDIDVQGRISQKGLEAVYKMDISWGSMVFDFTIAKEWDPYNHMYTGASYKWSDESFLNGNNKITTTNHSNADVFANFTIVKETGQLEGVDVKFKAVNADTSDAVNPYYIPKVAAENATPSSVDTYLWLSGTPQNLPGGTPATGQETTITKVGVITMTVTPDESGGLTPKS
ncbi:InlB B-repeat-containing protein [Robinsoniella peoriensis]|uniref:Internalin-A n=1 Tax=Robinsoniella peoriensis TaxID=180332 RepID=A0A4U8Q7X0_9FIRM|nr:InlB B-repeat-containing protein [Robinsoniella peoriensis]MDU7026648.1 InlB B-repeat-containing protein [Clostridiales bacterium]TLD00947.1 Internalin-A precursor [Robinsoniella peoriensis]